MQQWIALIAAVTGLVAAIGTALGVVLHVTGPKHQPAAQHAPEARQ